MLTLEPERLKNQLTTTRKRSPEMEGLFTGNAQAACDFSFSASKFSPFFHRVSVMAAILRARVRRTIVGLMPFASESLLEILKWSGLYTRPGGGSFEQTFQIVVVVLVQATNRDLFLGTSQLSFYVAVFASGAGFQCQSAIGPELSLGAKTMRGLEQGHRQR